MENKYINRVKTSNDILDIESSLEHSILTKESITQDLNLDSYYYEVLYIDEIPVGYIAYSLCIDHIDLLSIAVKPDYRKKGIAKELMICMENKCKGKNIDKIFLEVRTSNINAIRLYEKLNYTLINTRKNYYTNPLEDALIYMKEI